MTQVSILTSAIQFGWNEYSKEIPSPIYVTNIIFKRLGRKKHFFFQILMNNSFRVMCIPHDSSVHINERDTVWLEQVF